MKVMQVMHNIKVTYVMIQKPFLGYSQQVCNAVYTSHAKHTGHAPHASHVNAGHVGHAGYAMHNMHGIQVMSNINSSFTLCTTHMI